MFYAQINLTTRIVEAETMPHSPIDAPHMIEVSAEQYGTLLGKRHDEQAGAFVDVPVVVPVDPCEWLMDLGPFADRLGAHAFEVDTSTVPGVIAVAKDLARRKWVDLKDPRVAGSLYYLAGHTVPVLGTLAAPILTDAEVVAILTTPVPLEANRALRKVYFS